MLIFDCEIYRAPAPYGDKPRVAGVQYCRSWSDYANMGITVIGAYDYEEERYRVFMRDNLRAFAELLKRHDWCVGFNNHGFDNNLLAANHIHVDPARSYDLLAEIWAAAGLGPKFYSKTHGGYGLDNVCGVNFGLRKTADGQNAAVLWQQNRHGMVIDYCLNDIFLTKRLLDEVMTTGLIVDPKTGRQLRVARPGKAFRSSLFEEKGATA